MKKLSTMLAMLVLTTTIVACGGKKHSEEGKEPPVAAKPTTPDMTAPKTPDMAPPTPTTPPPATPAATADLPQDCKDYQAAVDTAMKCDKLAAARDTMKQTLATMAGTWKNLDTMTPDAKKTMADGCKTAATGVATSLKTAGC